MSWTWKSTLLGAAVAAIFLAVFGVQVNRVTSETQETQWRDSAMRQSALVERVILERAQNLKGNFPFSSFQDGPLSEPFRLAVDMELSSDGDLRVRDLRRTEEWTLGREETASLLSLLRQRDYQPGTVYWFLREAEGTSHHLMAFLGEASGAGFPQQASSQRLWAAVFEGNPFARLADDFKGAAAELVLQDSLGQVLLDSRSEEHSGALNGEPGWSQENGAALFRAEVPGTNLTLSYRVPADAMNFGKSSLTTAMIRLGAGILLLGSGLLFWWLRKSPEEVKVPESAELAEAPADTPQPEAKIIEVPGPVVRPAEKQMSALSEELHTHLWGLLGPIHQLKGVGLIPAHHQMILQMEEHVRPLMAASDSLRSYLQKEEFPMETLHLTEEMRIVLSAHKESWSSLGITVVEELEEDVWVKGSSFAFRKSLNEIIQNSMDALKGVSSKTLEFSLSKLEGEVRLRVADSGHGLEENVQPLAFEPFVGTKEGRLGLGLAFVRGVVAQMNGTAVFDARPSGGAQVLMTFKAAEAPALKAPVSPAKVEPEVSGPFPTEEAPTVEAAPTEAAAEKVPLAEGVEAYPLKDEEAWGLTTLDEDFSLDSSESFDVDLSEEAEEEEWSPVFSEFSPPASPRIQVRSPKRRDLQT